MNYLQRTEKFILFVVSWIIVNCYNSRCTLSHTVGIEKAQNCLKLRKYYIKPLKKAKRAGFFFTKKPKINCSSFNNTRQPFLRISPKKNLIKCCFYLLLIHPCIRFSAITRLIQKVNFDWSDHPFLRYLDCRHTDQLPKTFSWSRNSL